MIRIERKMNMKNMKKLLSLVLVLAGIASVSIFVNAGEVMDDDISLEESVGSTAAMEGEAFTLEEMLAYALQDELMAEAEYAAIIEEFGVNNPFTNIMKAEITHQQAVIGLYEARGMEVPDFDPSGHVVLPDTLEEIYAIGVQAEINNIAMYDKFLEQELDDDVRAVFTALRDGSVNHQAAFERAGSGTGYGGGFAGNGNSSRGSSSRGNGGSRGNGRR